MTLFDPLHDFEGLWDYGHEHIWFDCEILTLGCLKRWSQFLFILADLKEKEVKCLDSSLSPPEKVQLALDCLPKSSEKTLDGTNSSFCRWTIMDYAKAYRSGDITPSLVFSSFNFSFDMLSSCHYCVHSTKKLKHAWSCIALHRKTTRSFNIWYLCDVVILTSEFWCAISFYFHFLQVAERFIAAIDESTKPPLQMGFFIHYSADDILKQATESTLRYQRGSTSQQLKYQFKIRRLLSTFKWSHLKGLLLLKLTIMNTCVFCI